MPYGLRLRTFVWLAIRDRRDETDMFRSCSRPRATWSIPSGGGATSGGGMESRTGLRTEWFNGVES